MMRVEGLDNILRNLSSLDPKEWKKDAMKAMRQSQKAARADMRAAAPVDSGKLKKSIRTQAWMKRQKGGYEVSIAVRTGPKLKGRGRVWYAHFPEVGTTGQTAVHFVKDVQDKHGNSVMKDMMDVIYGVIDKANG